MRTCPERNGVRFAWCGPRSAESADRFRTDGAPSSRDSRLAATLRKRAGILNRNARHGRRIRLLAELEPFGNYVDVNLGTGNVVNKLERFIVREAWRETIEIQEHGRAEPPESLVAIH